MNAQDDLDRSLAGWFSQAAQAPPPPERLERIIEATRRRRPRPTLVAGVGSAWVGNGVTSGWAGRASLRPVLLIALVGLLVVALAGGAFLVGGGLTNSRTDDRTAGASDGLIMVAPDQLHGEIRVLRPDGQVVGVLKGAPYGCGTSTVVVADGKKVAYWSIDDLRPLTIAPLDGSDAVAVPPPPGGSWQLGDGAFSPDGSYFAHLSGPRPDHPDLTIGSLVDGTATVAARDLQGARNIAWSRGNTLAIGYVSGTESRIDLIDVDGTNHRPLIRQPRGGSSIQEYMPLVWSPDGTRLAYALAPSTGWPGATRIVEVATGTSTPVATADGRPFDAWTSTQNSVRFLWSPDGRTVAYSIEHGFGLLDLTSGETRTLSDADRVVPAWSPDGSRLAFMTYGPSEPRHLVTVHADLSGRIDQDLAPGASLLAWSPDGRQIAVLSLSGIDLHDPDAIEAPIRISGKLALSTYNCLWWSRVGGP